MGGELPSMLMLYACGPGFPGSPAAGVSLAFGHRIAASHHDDPEIMQPSDTISRSMAAFIDEQEPPQLFRYRITGEAFSSKGFVRKASE
ncbi:MAG: hypothetical protein KO206_06940 [Methanomicrobiaceae archaeon]|nr:hypothetical protein [Methanomicrobiaceae archaeon]MDD5418525.1 hypothetical protein [Methanomicrobiaceae archaeon]